MQKKYFINDCPSHRMGKAEETLIKRLMWMISHVTIVASINIG